jgi:hypothetical protein
LALAGIGVAFVAGGGGAIAATHGSSTSPKSTTTPQQTTPQQATPAPTHQCPNHDRSTANTAADL